jgi:MFS family permease
MIRKFGGKYQTLLLHATVLQLASFVVRPAATYRALELGVDPGYVGLLIASFAILPLFFSLFIGRASDRGRNSQILMSGSLIMVFVGIGFLSFSNSVLQLVVWILLLGLGHVMSVIGQQTLIANGASKDLDSAFGMYTFAGSLGQTIGPALILLASGREIIPDTQKLFAFYLLSVLLLLVITFPLIRGKRQNISEAVADPQIKIRMLWKSIDKENRPSLLIAMFVSLVAIGSVDVLAIYLPALGIERGIPAATIGLLMSIRALTTMVSRFYLAQLSRFFGRNRLIVLSTALAGSLLMLIALPIPQVVMIPIVILIGFSIGIGQPLTMTIITISVPASARSTWLSLRLTANRVGQAVVPAGVGLTTIAVGAGGAFAATGLLLLAVAGVSRRLPTSNVD